MAKLGKLPLVLLGILMASQAFAHASSRVFVLTLPINYYFVSAIFVILLSFAYTMFSDKKIGQLPLISIKIPKFPDCSLLVFIAWLMILYDGFWGTSNPLINLMPMVIWNIIWVGFVILSLIFGDIWQYLNPWRFIIVHIRDILGWRKTGGLDRLHYYPAILGFFGFACLEILATAPSDPIFLSKIFCGYWLVITIAGVYSGLDWLKKGEFLSVFFDLIAKISLGYLGKFRENNQNLHFSASIFIAFMLASVSFDGLKESFFWLNIWGINPLDFQGRSSMALINGFGLILSWFSFWCILMGVAKYLMKCDDLATQNNFFISFLPIAVGFHLAHYSVAFLINIQYLPASLQIISADKIDILSGFTKNYQGAKVIWNMQAFIIIIAHSFAMILTRNSTKIIINWWREAILLAILCLYTIYGLWLLSTPIAG